MEHPYLNSQLFAYIGNKRALLPFLRRSFNQVFAGDARGKRFYDPFAGTGSVSRLARLMGMDVHANDWEEYSQVYNRAYLLHSREDANHVFADRGGLEAVLQDINSRGRKAAESNLPDDAQAYISRHYAPPRTEDADFRRHRLFYSAENARFIDHVRHIIQQEFDVPAQRDLLTAALLYQAGTHANTSGVFKAYHKGFGGHGGDALGRILAPMELQFPALPSTVELPGNQSCQVSGNDATVSSGQSYDLVYLDPPYNGHQYGSNYFMLNTIARWDKPYVDSSRGLDGRFRKKAAIREDWVQTRSDFCSSAKAAAAFAQLLDALDSPRILLSYNTDGIIPFEQLVDILAGQGRVRLHTQPYAAFRGGRQSSSRRVQTLEFILDVDRRSSFRTEDLAEIRRISASRRIENLARASFAPTLVPSINHGSRTEGLGAQAKLLLAQVGPLDMPFLFEFSPSARKNLLQGLETLDPEDIEILGDELSQAAVFDHVKRAEILIDLIRREHASLSAGLSEPELRLSHKRLKKWIVSLLWSLRKFAFRKYQREYQRTIGQIRKGIADGSLPNFGDQLEALNRRVAPRVQSSDVSA